MSTELETLKRSVARYKGLVEVSALINSITDFDELLRAVLDVARDVLDAEGASLFLADAENGDLELVISSARAEPFRKPSFRVPRGKGIVGSVWETGKPALVKDAYDDPRFYRDADRQTGFRTRSVLCVPLIYQNAKPGVLQVLNPVAKPAFDQEDLEALAVYGNLIATAIEKLRALERIREQERIEHELGIAAEIQHEILANAVPEDLGGVEFHSFNEPAKDVGGDFYHALLKPGGEVCLSIGDVCGKGIPAALLMAQILSALEFVAASTARPAQILTRTNSAVHARVVRGMFATLLTARMLPRSRRIEIAGAAHCRPFVIGNNRKPKEVPLRGALPAGVFPDTRYKQRSVTLEPGQFLLVFTDGLAESRNPRDGTQFDAAMPDLLKGDFSSAEEVVRMLVEAEEKHRAGEARADDLTLAAAGFK